MSTIAFGSTPLLVACLCAGWCTTCAAYEATFADLARRHAGHRFVWIDIEAHSDALGDDALDIENFPTVMLLRGEQVLFYGTLLPHAATLDRMIDAAQTGHLAAGEPCPQALARAVATLSQQLPSLAQADPAGTASGPS